MRAVVQRVRRASVAVQGNQVSSIGAGLVVLLGVGSGDDLQAARYLAEKVAHLRIFSDYEGRMNRSVLDTGGEALVVSQFTLYGDCRKGRRPGFDRAARPELAEELYLRFVDYLLELGVPVATGRFQTEMLVEIHNDGPVTMLLDSERQF
ncbi:D-tyrosyl-tRNA(Tyr) deacylase [Clostridiales bacterium PH28_bin88]|nr:D-tyrosyl-tRNA(Tyr) deacylase [Clostridiales bacterium PH28_bin88]